jgi:DNA gyrase/topoisomerase IV subunit B
MQSNEQAYTITIEETFVTIKDNKRKRRSYVAARMYAQGEMNPVNSWTITITDKTGSRTFDRRTDLEQAEEMFNFLK